MKLARNGRDETSGVFSTRLVRGHGGGNSFFGEPRLRDCCITSRITDYSAMNRVEVLTDADVTYEAMFKEIGKARNHIHSNSIRFAMMRSA